MLPTHILRADWGTNAKKRWAAKAVLQSRAHYVAFAPEPVGAVADLIPRIQAEIGGRGCALIGFDFPIGVPALWGLVRQIMAVNGGRHARLLSGYKFLHTDDAPSARYTSALGKHESEFDLG